MSGSAPVARQARGLGWLRSLEAWLLFGYVLVVAAATFTVLIPELSKEPEATTSGKTPAVGAPVK